MLMHHAQPCADRSGGRRWTTGDAADGDRPSIGRNQAKRNPHESCLTGAVLPEETVDGAASDVDRCIVERDRLAEAFRDSCEHQRVGRVTHRQRRLHNPLGASMKVDVSAKDSASASPSARTPRVSVA